MSKRNLTFILLCILGCTLQTYGQTTKCLGPLDVTVIGSASGDTLSVEADKSNIYCAESDEGSINLQVSGGSPLYTCKWSHDTITTDLATDLAPGLYSVTVTDMNGCNKESSMEVTLMDPLLDSLSLVDRPSCGSCFLHDGGSSYFYDGDEYIAAIIDLETDMDLGNTQVCADMMEDMDDNGNPVLARCWSAISDSLEEADYRLFFTDAELDDLARRSGYSNGVALINSYSLYVKITTLTSDGSYPDIRRIDYGHFTITRYDAETGVWSLEMYGIENAKVELAAPFGALPVELLSFEGESGDGVNHLYWYTANEINSSHFNIERSKEGASFEKIGEVKAGRNDYAFDDEDPYIGDGYYRLQMVDIDGSFTYSHIIRLSQKHPFTFKVINNPFTDILMMEIENGTDTEVSLAVIGINGQIMNVENESIHEGLNKIDLQLGHLLSGNYVIRLQNKDTKEVISRKIVKI